MLYLYIEFGSLPSLRTKLSWLAQACIKVPSTTPKLNLSLGDMQLRVDPGWQNRMRAIDTQIEEVMRRVNRGVGR